MLDPDEQRHRDKEQDEATEDPPGSPAVDATERQRRHEREQADEIDARPRPIEPDLALWLVLLHAQEPPRDNPKKADRNVEPEDETPAEAGQPAAQDGPEDQPGADDHRVDTQRLAQFATRESVSHQRGRVGEHERATDALDDAARDKQ